MGPDQNKIRALGMLNVRIPRSGGQLVFRDPTQSLSFFSTFLGIVFVGILRDMHTASHQQ